MSWYWAILVAVNIPVFVLIWRKFFGDLDDFLECMRFWFTPDLISLFRGEWAEDRAAEFKLLLFFLACGSSVALEHLLLLKIGLVH